MGLFAWDWQNAITNHKINIDVYTHLDNDADTLGDPIAADPQIDNILS